jgi:cell shape-determining protein MreD
MQPLFVCLALWTLALVGETALLSTISWLQPNLLFLLSVLFALHWRGRETHFLAVFCGLTADGFSALPFGVFGLSFFAVSFFVRWYGIRISQPSMPLLVGLTAILTLAVNLLNCFVLDLIFSQTYMTFRWWQDVLFLEIIPTAILAPLGMRMLQYLEKRFRIRLAERQF